MLENTVSTIGLIVFTLKKLIQPITQREPIV